MGKHWILAGTLLALLSVPAAGIAQDEEEPVCVTTDKELNRVYKKVRATYKDEPLFLAKLKVAQRAWIKFRDGHLDSRYPLDPQAYGTASVNCWCLENAELTAARTKQLKKWLKGTMEGDDCYGSYKFYHQLKK